MTGRRRLSVLLCCAVAGAQLAAAAPGDLDPGFGSGGMVIEPGVGAAWRDVLVLPDGRIVTAGVSAGGLSVFALGRYLVDGTPDPSFGTGGRVVTSPAGLCCAQAYAVARQPDGRLVAAGSAGAAPAFTLVRYLDDGSLDPTFGVGGSVVTAVGSWDELKAIVIQGDGKIVVAGGSGTGSRDFILLRYLGDGSLDPAFGTGGIVVTAVSPYDDPVGAIAQQADGKLVVAGGTVVGAFFDFVFALARYDQSGALDPSFGSGGVSIVPLAGGEAVARSLLLQDDGKLVAAGSGVGSSNGYALTRQDAAGTLDLGFGTGGRVKEFAAFGDSYGLAGEVVGQPDGKLVVAGAAITPIFVAPGVIDVRGDAFVARYLDDGSPDETLRRTVDLGSDTDAGLAAALQPDGRLVVAGTAAGGFALFRLDASSCGNGRVEASETCDDGNVDSFDGCSGVCESETLHLLAGARLSVKDRGPEHRRLRMRSRDALAIPAPAPGSADDPRLTGATLLLFNATSGETASIALPPVGWQGLGTPPGARGYRFRRALAPGGPCGAVVLRAGRLLDARCAGAIGYSLDEPAQGGIGVALVIGGQVYCAYYGEEATVLADSPAVDGRGGIFTAKNAPPPAACLVP